MQLQLLQCGVLLVQSLGCTGTPQSALSVACEVFRAATAHSHEALAVRCGTGTLCSGAQRSHLDPVQQSQIPKLMHHIVKGTPGPP